MQNHNACIDLVSTARHQKHSILAQTYSFTDSSRHQSRREQTRLHSRRHQSRPPSRAKTHINDLRCEQKGCDLR